MKTMCVCILLTASACAHHDVSVCRHNAVFAAILHQAENQEDEVLLCLGWNEYRREWHAQAKYRKQGGGWIFLKNSPQFTKWESSQNNFEIKQEFTIRKWLDYLKIK